MEKESKLINKTLVKANLIVPCALVIVSGQQARPEGQVVPALPAPSIPSVALTVDSVGQEPTILSLTLPLPHSVHLPVRWSDSVNWFETGEQYLLIWLLSTEPAQSHLWQSRHLSASSRMAREEADRTISTAENSVAPFVSNLIAGLL